MSRTITITISIDVNELVASYPKGGTITGNKIISMSSDSGEDTWENGNHAKLITVIDSSDVLVWNVVSKTAGCTVALTQFIGDSSKDLILAATPVPVPGTQNTQWTGQAKNALPKGTSCTYCFKFTSNCGRDLYWQWDPIIKPRI
jgi:hypothetical protein